MNARYWYVTAAAAQAIEQAVKESPHRSWNPLGDSPSLNTLPSKRNAARYRKSRNMLFDHVGVLVLYRKHYFRKAKATRLVGFVWLPTAEQKIEMKLLGDRYWQGIVPAVYNGIRFHRRQALYHFITHTEKTHA